MSSNERNLLFKTRLYVNYINNILEHTEIEEAVEKEILNSFHMKVGSIFYKVIFDTYNRTRMDCYYKYQSFVTERPEIIYLYSKLISYGNLENGFWVKKVTHFKDNQCI